MEVALIIHILELTGTAAFAVSGALVGIKKQSDIFGVIFIGVTTAVGGGITRDLMLGITPPSAFCDPVYIILACVTSAAVFIYAYLNRCTLSEKISKIDRANNLTDSLGLGVFTITGINTAVFHGYTDNALLVIFLGMLTGIGGGIIRDTMIGTVPFVLKKKIYAMASICGGAVYYLFIITEGNQNVGAILGIATVFLIRMLATKYSWNLPKVPTEQNKQS